VRPFRFAITASHARSAAEWRATARRVEALGYDLLLMPDHLTGQLAPVPALMAALDATTTLRAGSFVLANDYRNPVLLAKEIATLDVLSGGRIELGIGAGWAKRDYRMLGLSYDAPRTRVARLFEAVRLIDRLLTEESVDFTGRFYTVRDARVLPRPVQRPRPPFMIAGGGVRMLRFAARHADSVGLLPRMDERGRPHVAEATMGATARKLAWIRQGAGERIDRIDVNVIVFDAGVVDRPRSLVDGALTRGKALATSVLDTPYVLYGSHAELRRRLIARRERLGISYYALPERAMDAFAPLVRELHAL